MKGSRNKDRHTSAAGSHHWCVDGLCCHDVVGQKTTLPALDNVRPTWCAPCRKECGLSIGIYAQFKDAGLVLIGVNVGQDRSRGEKFLKTFSPTYSIVLSDDSDIVAAFRVTAFPTYVLMV